MSALKGLDNFLTDLAEVYLFEKNETLQEIVLEKVKTAKQTSHIPHDFGELERSFYVEPTATGVAFGFTAPHGVYSEFGTGKYYNLNFGTYFKLLDGGFARSTGRQTPWTYYDVKRGKFFTTSGQEAQHWFEDMVLNVKVSTQIEIERKLGEVFDVRY